MNHLKFCPNFVLGDCFRACAKFLFVASQPWWPAFLLSPPSWTWKNFLRHCNIFIVWSFVHNSSQFGAIINCWMKEDLQLLVPNKYVAFCVSEHWLVFHTLLTNLFKVQSRNTILIYWLWSKSTIKTPERCHVVFSFNFEHIQQINLIFSLLTLKMYLSVGHRIKFTKQSKCTLNNRAVSLKHVHVAWVSLHGLNNP